MYSFSLRYPDFRSFVRLYSLARKSHYEVLRLKKNCTDKEIKEAFIKMSKEYHPDKNKDVNAQETFVRIVEAYNILGKAGSRAQYDITSEVMQQSGPPRSYYSRPDPYYHVRHPPNYHQYHYNYYYKRPHNQEQKAEDNSQSYYGVKGLKKMPNYVIILVCFGFALVGSIMQAIVIREMYVVNRRQTYEKSRQLAEELEKVRSGAKQNTNEMQTRLLLEKIVSSANPTIATASLGQALASDKKEQLGSFLTEFGVSSPTHDQYAECQGITVNIHDVLRKVRKIYHYCWE